jgi:glucan phosphoethanolaminetransferase (alkaline phosphatase superfamily)
MSNVTVFLATECRKLYDRSGGEGTKKIGITVSKPVLAIICIIFRILVIVFPGLLQWIVGLFLIIQGILLLTDYLELRK